MKTRPAHPGLRPLIRDHRNARSLQNMDLRGGSAVNGGATHQTSSNKVEQFLTIAEESAGIPNGNWVAFARNVQRLINKSF